MPLALPSFLSTFQPLYQDMFLEAWIMLSPCHPEMGTKGWNVERKEGKASGSSERPALTQTP